MSRIALFLLLGLGYFNTINAAPQDARHVIATIQSLPTQAIATKTINLYDTGRKRTIPLQIYVSPELQGKAKVGAIHLPVVIINHGYSVKNTEYSFLANALAAQGYFVVSIQHDLKTDLELAQTGSLYERRKPMWERGVANILFVQKKLRQTKPYLDLDKITLIGHSNGGDITMLFVTTYPELVTKAVSLDSLRMPFPRKGQVPILSLRANDTVADKGVLPPQEKRHKLKITIIDIGDAKHIDMCDRGPKSVHEEINNDVLTFLKISS